MADSSVNLRAIQAIMHSPDGPVMKFLLRVGNRVRSGAAERCNVDTGRLRSSIQVVMTAEPSVRVGTDVDYAIYVHEGTQPHFIFPVNKRFLSWVTPEGRVFARAVAHPGYRGNPFLTDAMHDVLRSI